MIEVFQQFDSVGRSVGRSVVCLQLLPSIDGSGQWKLVANRLKLNEKIHKENHYLFYPHRFLPPFILSPSSFRRFSNNIELIESIRNSQFSIHFISSHRIALHLLDAVIFLLIFFLLVFHDFVMFKSLQL